jgi:hypothetical protein
MGKKAVNVRTVMTNRYDTNGTGNDILSSDLRGRVTPIPE